MTSKDGMTWAKTTGPHFAEPAASSVLSLATNLCFGNGIFMGLEEDSSSNGPYNTYTSPDGVTWTAHPISHAWGNMFAASNTGFTLVGSGGSIYTTADDGVTWNSASSPTISATATAWGHSMFAIVGTGGNIYTSPDGTFVDPALDRIFGKQELQEPRLRQQVRCGGVGCKQRGAVCSHVGRRRHLAGPGRAVVVSLDGRCLRQRRQRDLRRYRGIDHLQLHRRRCLDKARLRPRRRRFERRDLRQQHVYGRR